MHRAGVGSTLHIIEVVPANRLLHSREKARKRLWLWVEAGMLFYTAFAEKMVSVCVELCIA